MDPEGTIDFVAAANACWYLAACVAGGPVNLLVDTGAACTLLNTRVYRALPETRRPSLAFSAQVLRAANGGLVTVHGAADMTIEVEGVLFTHSVVVADLGGIPAVLGSDFLEEYQVVLDIGRGLLLAPAVEATLHKKESDGHCALVRLTATCDIHAGSMRCVTGLQMPFNLDQELEEAPGLVEPNSGELELLGLYLPEAFVTRDKRGAIFLAIANTSDVDVEVSAGTVIAMLHRAGELSVGEVMSLGAGSLCEDPVPPDVGGDLPEYLQPLIDTLPPELTPAQRRSVVRLVHRYQDIFATPDGPTGRTNVAEPYIDTGDAHPIRLPPR
jgi:hypothetical protein